MSSLFTRKRIYAAELITLPSFCVPGTESAHLQAKRDAQLKWMREKGVRYLGSPMALSEEPRAVVRSIQPAVRLVNKSADSALEQGLARIN